MNKERRKEIDNLLLQVSECVTRLDCLKQDIETIRDEEQECYDNLPESLQQGEKGEAMSQAVEYLESAISAIDSAIDSANEAENELSSAQE